MCIGDGNPKPEVTITGPDIRNVGKEVVQAEITVKEKEVFWCQAKNELKVASKKLTGNSASVLPSFRVPGRYCCVFHFHFPLSHILLVAK